MAKRDYYEVLGLTKSATDDEVKRAYRQLAMKHHPDRNQGDEKASELFKEASEAYEILSDSKRRATYDRYGHEGVRGSFGQGGFSWDDFHHFGDFEDILGSFLGGIFGSGSSSSRQSSRFRGRDLRIQYPLTLEEVLTGREAEIKVTRLEVCEDCGGSGMPEGVKSRTCPQCQGSGQVRYNQGFFAVNTACNMCQGEGQIIDRPCPSCRGNGRVNKRSKANFDIPKGVEDGMQIRVAGEGEAGVRGGPRGDLYVSLSVKRHDRFRREEDDLHCDEPVSFAQLTLGDRIRVTLLDGEATVDIPSGTQTHTSFRLRGQGLPSSPGNDRRGDLYARVIAQTPKNLNDKQIELLRDFAEARGEEAPSGPKGFFDKVKEIFTPGGDDDD